MLPVSVFHEAGRKKKFMTSLSNVHSFPSILSIESLPMAAIFSVVGRTNVNRDLADPRATKVMGSDFKETRTLEAKAESRTHKAKSRTYKAETRMHKAETRIQKGQE